MKLSCNCRKRKGVEIPSLVCKQGATVDVCIMEDVGSFVWYAHTIAAFKIKRMINLNVELPEEDFRLLSNPDASKLMFRLNHHLLGILYYHGDRIYGPWHKPLWGSDIPAQYSVADNHGRQLYVFGTLFRRRGKNAMPLPTKRAIFGFIDQALAGPSNA